MQREEDVIQARCKSWLDGLFDRTGNPLAAMTYHVGNERVSARRRAVMNRMGVKKGVPDWIIPGRGAIEMKTPTGRLAPSQKDYLICYANEGEIALVCSGTKTFCLAIGQVLDIDPRHLDPMNAWPNEKPVVLYGWDELRYGPPRFAYKEGKR